MAQPHAVEVLLRPAVELHTVAVCTGAAILCLVAPWSLALNPLLGLGSALAFLSFGAIRLRDAWAILRYRRMFDASRIGVVRQDWNAVRAELDALALADADTLGAPYWDMYARGAILGITRGTGRAHVARAVLECIAYQVTDLMLAMRQDAGCDITALRVDGGASVSDILMQLQADLLRIPVDRPEMVETTAFGAAALAGLSCGVWSGLEELTRLRRSQRVFLPTRPQADCDRDYRLWKRAVSRASDWIEH